jgi:hypothetical protein
MTRRPIVKLARAIIPPIQKTQKLPRLASFAAILSLILAVFSSLAPQAAQARGLGLGVFLGEPTGLTGKYWMGNDNALDFKLAWSFSDYFLITGDYLFHFPGAFGRKNQFVSQLSPYVGPGGAFFFGRDRGSRFRDDDDFAFGIRFPVGVEWISNDPPIGVFIELAPGLSIAPSTDGFFMGGIGARFYFQ